MSDIMVTKTAVARQEITERELMVGDIVAFINDSKCPLGAALFIERRQVPGAGANKVVTHITAEWSM